MHLIQQHTFDIQCSSQAFGKEIHSQLSLLLEKEFYPQLELLLDKYDSKNNTIGIDALAVEIPNVSRRYWKEELVQQSLAQIEAYLKQHCQFNFNEVHHTIADPTSTSIHSEYILFEFLKTGSIIENSIASNLEILLIEVDINDRFIKALLSIFESSKNALIRWIFSMPNYFKKRVIGKLNEFTNAVYELEKSISIHKVPIHIERQWLELVNWSMYLERRATSKENVFSNFVKVSEDYFEIKTKDLLSICQFILTTTEKEDIKMFFRKIESSFENDIVSEKLDKVIYIDHSVKSKLSENSHYIKNAGLIILHPFLKTFFEQLDLCDAHGNWVTKLSQHKAILLTQYLIESSTKIQESDLLLNKLLCGFAIDEVVNVQLEFTTKEKEKCFDLLQAVNGHWKVMNTSSVEALQQTFLQREGKLELTKENDYELWVEEKGVDILMDQLPWGICMIQSPWMESYLYCHWA